MSARKVAIIGHAVVAPNEICLPDDPNATTKLLQLYNFTRVVTEDGRIKADWVLGQDQAAWIIQGSITDRTTERLGVTDVGIIMFRRMLEEQMQVVADGGESMNVHRDPEKNEGMLLATEHTYYPGYAETGGPFRDRPLVPPQVEASMI